MNSASLNLQREDAPADAPSGLGFKLKISI